MRYRHLGRTGLQVSRLVLGTMNFGHVTDEAASFQIMDGALEAGINLFDTADVYGGPQSPDMDKGSGLSEEIIGRVLALRPQVRSRGHSNPARLSSSVARPAIPGWLWRPVMPWPRAGKAHRSWSAPACAGCRTSRSRA